MVRPYRIVVLPGDGIGQEVVPQAIRALQAISERHGLVFEFHEAAVGGLAIDQYGVPLPEESLKIVRESDTILMGAVGGPKWEGLDYSIRPERALLGLRQELGLYANLRPAKLFPMLAEASTLKREVIEGIDLLVVRELTGEFISEGQRESKNIGAARKGLTPRSIPQRRSSGLQRLPSRRLKNAEERSPRWTRPMS